MDKLLQEHLARHWAENATERWTSAPDGTFELAYSDEALAKSLSEPGWCRVWRSLADGRVVGHASLYDAGMGDGLAFGHVGIEAPYRGKGIAPLLQGLRLGFCDEHGIALAGPCAPTNNHSYRGCLKAGFRHVHTDDNGDRWMLRLPAGLTWATEGTV